MLSSDTCYFVESSEDDTVLIAIDAKIANGLVEWFDTVRDRAFEVESTEEAAEGLQVGTPRAKYRFMPLTRELYDKRVRGQVTGHRAFNSTEELQAFYRDFPR